MRLALLGGSFDPPHLGHLLAAASVLLTREPDELWIAPVQRHPFGKPLAPFEDRLAMVALAVASLGPRVRASPVEAEAAAAGSQGTTVELLRFLRRRQPADELLFIVGADILGERDRWSHWEEIERLATLTVVNRAGFPEAPGAGPSLPELSSTELRRRIAHGEPFEAWLPAAVARFVRDRGLYRSG